MREESDEKEDRLMRDAGSALSIAATAPSSHNSQPWALAWLSSPGARQHFGVPAAETTDWMEPALLLAIDKARAIGALPALQVENRVSCGMFLELLIDAMQALGWETTVSMLEDELLTTKPTPASWEPLAILRFRRGTTSSDAFPAARRITNRGPYAREPISDAVVDQLRTPRSRVLNELNQDGRIALTLVDRADTIAEMGSFVSKHAGIDFGHAKAWAETYRCIHFSSRSIQEADSGMPVTQLLGPMSAAKRAVLRMILSPSAMSILKLFRFHSYMGRQLGQLVAAAPLLAVFSLKEGTTIAQVAGGGAALHFWMKLTGHDLALHPVSVILQHDSIRNEFEDRFGFDGRVFLFCRVGRPLATFGNAPKRNNLAATVLEL